jgi:hypothetical protein
VDDERDAVVAATTSTAFMASPFTQSNPSPEELATTFHDPAGHVTEFARTDLNGVEHFYDHALRPTGSSD